MNLTRSWHITSAARCGRPVSGAVARLLVALALIGAPERVIAQGANPVTFEVTPAVAGPGVDRKVSVSLLWPSGCLPAATLVGTETVVLRSFTLTLLLNDNQGNVSACGDLLVTHRATVSYRPAFEGDLRVLGVTNRGVYLGETVLHTRAANSDRSQFDLTGMWYDPATYGSGLTFVHGYTHHDVLFGTWYVYDAQGMARWYTIQGVQWQAGGLEADGQIYETRAGPAGCMLALSGCPLAAASALPQMRAHLVLQGPNSARIQALTAGGTVLFSSNLQRSIF